MNPISPATRAALVGAGLKPDATIAFVEACVQEDLAGGVDVTSVSTISADDESTANFVVRGPGVIAGAG